MNYSFFPSWFLTNEGPPRRRRNQVEASIKQGSHREQNYNLYHSKCSMDNSRFIIRSLSRGIQNWQPNAVSSESFGSCCRWPKGILSLLGGPPTLLCTYHRGGRLFWKGKFHELRVSEDDVEKAWFYAYYSWTGIQLRFHGNLFFHISVSTKLFFGYLKIS